MYLIILALLLTKAADVVLTTIGAKTIQQR